MKNRSQWHKFTALALLLGITMGTAPVSASELSPSKPVIGSVSGTGVVELRGLRISQEGTVFPDDVLRVGEKSYAKVILANGQKLELGEKTDVTLSEQKHVVRVQLKSGNLAFTAAGSAPLNVAAGLYEIVPKGSAVGSVVIVGGEYAGVRVIRGTITVRHSQSSESILVTAGEERLLSLRTFSARQPVAQLASTLPGPVPPAPSMPPQAPAGRTGGGGLSTTGWIAVLATIGGAAAAIAVLASRGEEEKADAAAQAAQQKAISNLQAITSTAQLTSNVAAQTTTSTTQIIAAIGTSTAIPAGQRTAFTATAQTILSRAQSASQSMATLTTQVQQLQTQIQSQSGGPTTQQQQQLNQFLADLERARAEANQALLDAQALANQARQFDQNIPSGPNIQPVPAPTIASASIPF